MSQVLCLLYFPFYFQFFYYYLPSFLQFKDFNKTVVGCHSLNFQNNLNSCRVCFFIFCHFIPSLCPQISRNGSVIDAISPEDDVEDKTRHNWQEKGTLLQKKGLNAMSIRGRTTSQMAGSKPHNVDEFDSNDQLIPYS